MSKLVIPEVNTNLLILPFEPDRDMNSSEKLQAAKDYLDTKRVITDYLEGDCDLYYFGDYLSEQNLNPVEVAQQIIFIYESLGF